MRSARGFGQVACRKHGRELKRSLFTVLKRRLRAELTAAAC